MAKDLTSLMAAIGYNFKNVSFLEVALCHRSVGRINNERLEFLGDAILNFIVAKEIFNLFPQAQEGQLTRLRANLVNEVTLAAIAKEFSLSNYLRLGKGEQKTGGALRESILADAIEAIICAIYVDSNFDTPLCQKIVISWFKERLTTLSLNTISKDSKSILQEYMQGRNLPLPQYELVDILGSQHEQTFVVKCKVSLLQEQVIGQGASRRKAEQEAAQRVLTQLNYE